MDIDLAFKELLKYVVVFIMTSSILFGVCYALKQSLGIDVSLTTKNIEVIIFVFTFIFLFNFLLGLINHQKVLKNFFSCSDFETFKKAVRKFNQKDIFYQKTSALKNILNKIFIREWIVKKVSIYKKDDLKEYSALINHLQKSKKILTKQTLFEKEGIKDLVTNIEKIKGDLFIPLFSWTGKDLLAVLVLTKEQNKTHPPYFTKQELDVINSMIDHLTLCYQVIHYNKNIRAENEKLKKLDKAKDSFISLVSHELRTPITVIKGYSDFLLKGDSENLLPKQKKFIKEIYNGTDELNTVVKNILNISKIKVGNIDLDLQEINLKNSVKGILEKFHPLAKEKSVIYDYEISTDLPPIFVTDYTKLVFVLENLIGNAFKFISPQNKIHIKIEKLKSDKIQFIVEDSGDGIPAEDLPNIFDCFEQAGSYLKKTKQGAGLGLYIAKEFVKKMGGDIFVESEKGKGAKFTFVIPSPQNK